MSAMGELNFFIGLQVLQKEDGIFLSQDKYVGDILKKFRYLEVRSSNTPMGKENPWGKYETGKDVDLHLYRSMIGSLMYLTASRPDIMFAVCACFRHQVTPKECHLHVVKRIFRYLKGHLKLRLWYPKESPFDLVTYSDSDYGGATQDRKSTTRGCQFLGRQLISWQCKKKTIVATSTTKAEYVAAASCYGQVLWIQNQLLDYEYNFMNTKIYIDNNNAIYLLTKHFDAGRFQYLVCKLFLLLGKLSTVSVFLGFGLKFAGTSKYWGVLRILMTSLRLISLDPNNGRGNQILATMDGIHRTVTESSLRRNLKLQDEEGISSLPDTELFENLTLMGYNISSNQKFTFQKVQFSHQWKRTRIAQSSVLPTIADEPASPLRDVSQGEACPTNSGFIADQDRATINKSSTLPHDSAPRVTSPVAAQDVEINRLKDKVKLLEEREGVAATRSKDDAPINGRSMDEGEVATERISDDSEEMATVLTSMDAATVLASGVVDVPTGSGSIPTASTPAEEQVPTGSDVVLTASLVFAIATMVTPYRRWKGKEVMVESETPKKQKFQEQIDA
nr:hypothetical protein [Tanacetum cinerariifolium]